MRLTMLSVLGVVSLSLSTVALGMSEGERKFNAKCAACHGKDGKGQTTMGKKLKVKDLTDGAIAKYTDDQLVKKIEVGDPAKKFPAFKGKLSEDEIRSIAVYLRTLK